MLAGKMSCKHDKKQPCICLSVQIKTRGKKAMKLGVSDSFERSPICADDASFASCA